VSKHKSATGGKPQYVGLKLLYSIASDSAFFIVTRKTIREIVSEFISNSVRINTPIYFYAFIGRFKFGTPAFPKSGAIFSHQSLMEVIGVNIC